MQNNKIRPLERLYNEHLKTIEGIKFTKREIDVIACILSGRAVKTIADLLSISPRTVESHTYKILLKLESSSRENIISFIERSGKFSLVQKYYLDLITKNNFKKGLKQIGLSLDKGSSLCSIYCLQSLGENHLLIDQIQQDLKLAGINVFIEIKKGQEPLETFSKKTLSKEWLSKIYVGSKSSLLDLSSKNKNLDIRTLYSLETNNINLKDSIFFAFEKEQQYLGDTSCSPDAIKIEKDSYYILLIKFLKKLLFPLNVEDYFSLFYKQHETREDNINKNYPPKLLNKDDSTKSSNVIQRPRFILNYKKYLSIIGGIFIIALVSVWILGVRNKNLDFLIRSELHIPTESAFLKRPDLIKEIEKKLTTKEKIETVALVGIGGAGKTTIAREFGRYYEASVVWEINAETKNSLINSFKSLIFVLAKTPERKKEIEFMEKIQGPKEKEFHLLFLIKKWLREDPNWLLIYDNVEALLEIKNYFPEDPKIWGAGKIIITTRDGNIRNTSYIKSDNIIYIEALTSKESLTLFSKIFYEKEPHQLTAHQKKEAVNFLKNIPPFPLDISMAAHYLKNNHIIFKEYLDRIKKYGGKFENIQESLLKETNNYTKTRYGIITSSFEKLIYINPRYKELLFFICLLDSQNIPKNLLESFKNKTVLDTFIHDLRKNFFIISKSSIDTNEDDLAFFLHRSTQEIGLVFLINVLGQREREDFTSSIIKKIKDYYERNKKENHKIVSLIPHLDSFLKNLKIINIPFKLKDKYEMDFLLMLAYAHYQHTQNLVLSKKIFIQIINLNLEKRKLSNHIFSNVLKDLGVICFMLGDFDESITYCQKSIDNLKKSPNSELLIAENLEIMGASYDRKNNFNLSKEHFEEALNVISTLPLEEKQERESEIYRRLSMLYNNTYLGKYKAYEMENHALNSLLAIKNLESFYKNSQIKSGISCENIEVLARGISNLGYIYATLGKYKDGMKKLREAQNIIDSPLNKETSCSHFILKSFISRDIGTILLREGYLEAADNELTQAIDTLTKSLGEYSCLPLKVYRAEARIRLKKFKDAYKDCLDVFRLKKEDETNYRKIGYLTCLYHAAIIKYKQEDLEKSLEHFSDFFKKMKIFCKDFLEEKKYKDLESKNVFADIDLTKIYSKADIRQYLARSTHIFTSIYSSEHPFVKDYVMKN